MKFKTKKIFEDFWKAWKIYWFKPSFLFDLSVFRIVFVASFLFDLTQVNLYIEKLLTLSQLPNSLYNGQPILRLLCFPFGWNRPPITFLITAFWISLVAGITSLAGFKTNLSLIIFLLGNIILRAYIFSFGFISNPDAVTIIALGILSLSPAGKVLSIEELQQRLKLSKRQRKLKVFNILNSRSVYARWPILLVKWMLAIIYFDAAISKLTAGPGFISLDWLNGYTLQAYLLKPFTEGFDLGNWLGQHHSLAVISSYITILFEGTFFLVLIFPRLAWIYIPMGIAFHAGIFLTMKMNFFIVVAAYTVFIPWASIVKNLLKRWQRFIKPSGTLPGSGQS